MTDAQKLKAMEAEFLALQSKFDALEKQKNEYVKLVDDARAKFKTADDLEGDLDTEQKQLKKLLNKFGGDVQALRERLDEKEKKGG